MSDICPLDIILLRPTDRALDMGPATQTTQGFCSSIGYRMNPPIQFAQILYSPHSYQIICTNDEPYHIVVLSSQSIIYQQHFWKLSRPRFQPADEFLYFAKQISASNLSTYASIVFLKEFKSLNGFLF